MVDLSDTTGTGLGMRIDPELFRGVLGRFGTGLVVITAADDEGEAGMTCQSFASLSLDPPLVMFCPGRTSTTWPRIRQVGRFAVSILAEGQAEIGRRFARSGTDKFAGVDRYPGVTGAPLIAGALAHLECRLMAEYDGGDHTIVVGVPIAMSEGLASEPLLYYRGRFGGFRPATSGG